MTLLQSASSCLGAASHKTGGKVAKRFTFIFMKWNVNVLFACMACLYFLCVCSFNPISIFRCYCQVAQKRVWKCICVLLKKLAVNAVNQLLCLMVQRYRLSHLRPNCNTPETWCSFLIWFLVGFVYISTALKWSCLGKENALSRYNNWYIKANNC